MELSIRDIKDIIPEFDGNSLGLNEFVRACNFAQKNIKNGNEEVLLFIIHSKLSGSAKDLISGRNLTSWSEMEDLLISRFGDRRDTESLLRDLTSTFQGKHETLRAYLARTENLLSKIRNSIASNEDLSKTDRKILAKSYELKKI